MRTSPDDSVEVVLVPHAAAQHRALLEVQLDVAPEAEGLRLVDARRHHDASAAPRGRLVDELLEVDTAGARGEERKRGSRREKESSDFHVPHYTTFRGTAAGKRRITRIPKEVPAAE